MSVSNNLVIIYDKIKASAIRANRNPDAITLIAVTKYVPIPQINEAIAWGVRHVAENRVQEGIKKFPALNGSVTKHLIGTLQTNKVKAALECFDLVHSVDRWALVEELAKQTEKREQPIYFLVQLNLSGELSKHGLSADELDPFLDKLSHFPRLVPCGLMTMAPLGDEPEQSRPLFRRLRQLFETVAQRPGYEDHWRYLSMGMSQDYTVAVEEGANLLRVGTAIFKDN